MTQEKHLKKIQQTIHDKNSQKSRKISDLPQPDKEHLTTTSNNYINYKPTVNIICLMVEH